MNDVDLYEILNVPKNCSQEEMKKSYKKLCIQHHPDKGGNEEEFKKVSEAYNILKDPEKRDIYDKFGFEGLKGGAGGMNDEQMQSMMNNLFGFGFPFKQQQQQRVNNINHNVEISLEDIVNGNAEYRLKLQRKVLDRTVQKMICNVCKGQGFRNMTQNMGFMQLQQHVKCPQCHGNKYENANQLFKTMEEDIILPIPVHCAENNVFILKNKMDEDVDGKSGDVMYTVKYKKHSVFQRKNKDLYIDLKITFKESLLGFTKEIELLDHTTLKISYPHILKWQIMLCIPDKGLFLDKSFGNLYIRFVIDYPDMITLSLLKELEQDLNTKTETLSYTPSNMKEVPFNIDMDNSNHHNNKQNDPSRPPPPPQSAQKQFPFPHPFQAQAQSQGQPQQMECNQQ